MKINKFNVPKNRALQYKEKPNKEVDKALNDALTLGKGFVEVSIDKDSNVEHKYHSPRKVYYTTKQEIEHE
jgi:hypothetical protein